MGMFWSDSEFFTGRSMPLMAVTSLNASMSEAGTGMK
jgi:hypothetical protein